MSIKVGIDFGTSNSGVAVYDGQRVQLLPVDPKNVLPEVIKTVLYVTRDYRTSIGQEAVENYYRDNVNRQRRYVKQWVGEIDVRVIALRAERRKKLAAALHRYESGEESNEGLARYIEWSYLRKHSAGAAEARSRSSSTASASRTARRRT